MSTWADKWLLVLLAGSMSTATLALARTDRICSRLGLGASKTELAKIHTSLRNDAAVWPHTWNHSASRRHGADLHRGSLLKPEHILNHFDYNTSQSSFVYMVSLMARPTDARWQPSMHSGIHIIRPLLDLLCSRRSRHRGMKRCVYLEIGAFCGASLALALSYPGTSRAIGITMPHPKTNSALQRNARCFNVHDAGVHLVLDFSTTERAVNLTRDALQGDSVDLILMDGPSLTADVAHDFQYYVREFLTPGGVVVLDDYYPENRKAAADTMASKYCPDQFSCIGQLPNQARATCLPGAPACDRSVVAKLSNEFLMQRKVAE